VYIFRNILLFVIAEFVFLFKMTYYIHKQSLVDIICHKQSLVDIICLIIDYGAPIAIACGYNMFNYWLWSPNRKHRAKYLSLPLGPNPLFEDRLWTHLHLPPSTSKWIRNVDWWVMWNDFVTTLHQKFA
jgi:hypothetical protein